MEENPYAAPSSSLEAVGVNSGTREDLRKVAMYQKLICVCILFYLGAVFAQFVVPKELFLFVALGVLVAAVVGTICVFLLAMKVYSPVVGILLGLLTLVPCIGLLVLLAVNAKATDTLKKNNIKVGLLGANLNDI